MIAAAGGDLDVAVGNIIGSNIANLSLLLGVGALIIPLGVGSATVRRELPITVAAMVLIALFLQRGLSRWEGAVLLSAMITTLWWLWVNSQEPGSDPLGAETETFADEPDHHSIRTEALRTAGGLIGTVAGAQLLLWGAIDLADRAGLGRGFVGATLVAMGTSLPELVTVVQSARRRETDLIVGNLLGSNLFNALAVGGLVGLVAPGTVGDRSLTIIAAGAAVVVAIVAAAAMVTGHRIVRREGLVLIAGYLVIVPLLR